jgi:hypothetical protein
MLEVVGGLPMGVNRISAIVFLLGAAGALSIILLEMVAYRIWNRLRRLKEDETPVIDSDEETIRELMNIPDELPVVRGDDGTWYVITGDHEQRDVRRNWDESATLTPWVDDVKDAIALGQWWSTEIDGITHRVGAWRGGYYPMCACCREPLHPDNVESHPMGLGPAVTCERCLS